MLALNVVWLLVLNEMGLMVAVVEEKEGGVEGKTVVE